MAEKTNKTAVIQAVKAIAVLVIICLVCVLLLALCNDLLYISDDVRLSRSMQTIYKNFELDTTYDYNNVNPEYATASYGKINKVYRSTDGAFVVEAMGNGGYSNGTVTLYVVVGANTKIIGWAVKENVGQSFIDRIPSDAGTTWYVGQSIVDDITFTMTGATVMATSTAIYNAVQMAAYYCHYALSEQFGLGEVAPPTEDDNIAKFHVHEDGTAFVRDTEFDESLDTEAREKYVKYDSYGEVLSIARCEICGAFVIESLGIGGYENGTVTLYVVVSSEGLIEVWSIKENVGQSYINNIPSNAGTIWYVGQDITEDINNMVNDNGSGAKTGATFSATAIWNAVRMAAYFAHYGLAEELGLVTEDPIEQQNNALAAATELLADTDFSNYTLNITDAASITIGGKTLSEVVNDGVHELSYLFVGEGDNGTVYVFVFGKTSSRKIIAVCEGNLVAKSDNVEDSDGILTNALSFAFLEITFQGDKFSAIVQASKDGSEVVYTITVTPLSNYVPSTYVLEIKITTDGGVGKIADIGIVESGWADGWPDKSDADILGELLVGATSDTVDSMYDNGKVTDATESANIITAAVKAALAHYDANFAN